MKIDSARLWESIFSLAYVRLRRTNSDEADVESDVEEAASLADDAINELHKKHISEVSSL